MIRSGIDGEHCHAGDYRIILTRQNITIAYQQFIFSQEDQPLNARADKLLDDFTQRLGATRREFEGTYRMAA